jgi:small subunit ribosomal protein S8
MSLSDPIGDLLTRIRNGQKAGKTSVVAPASGLKVSALDVLKREGYIRDFSLREIDACKKEVIVELKYVDRRPVIQEIKRVSRPGRRVYCKIGDLKKVYNGLGISVISTCRGVLSDNEARTANVGGEVMFKVF